MKCIQCRLISDLRRNEGLKKKEGKNPKEKHGVYCSNFYFNIEI
jgi:hypothetical protein